MKRALLILSIIILMTGFVAYSQVAIETGPSTPINSIMPLFSASSHDITTLTLTGASDTDSTGLYNHDPFTSILVHVECDSVNAILATRNGYASQATPASSTTDGSIFYFATATVLDTITAAGDYIYPIIVTESMHLYHTLTALSGNGISTFKIFAIRRKYE
jgi:hypothetical protein